MCIRDRIYVGFFCFAFRNIITVRNSIEGGFSETFFKLTDVTSPERTTDQPLPPILQAVPKRMVPKGLGDLARARALPIRPARPGTTWAVQVLSLIHISTKLVLVLQVTHSNFLNKLNERLSNIHSILLTLHLGSYIFSLTKVHFALKIFQNYKDVLQEVNSCLLYTSRCV